MAFEDDEVLAWMKGSGDESLRYTWRMTSTTGPLRFHGEGSWWNFPVNGVAGVCVRVAVSHVSLSQFRVYRHWNPSPHSVENVTPARHHGQLYERLWTGQQRLLHFTTRAYFHKHTYLSFLYSINIRKIFLKTTLLL